MFLIFCFSGSAVVAARDTTGGESARQGDRTNSLTLRRFLLPRLCARSDQSLGGQADRLTIGHHLFLHRLSGGAILFCLLCGDLVFNVLWHGNNGVLIWASQLDRSNCSLMIHMIETEVETLSGWSLLR